MPRQGSVASAIVYFLIIGIAGAGIQLFWRVTLFSRFDPDPASPLAALALSPDESPLTSFLMTPLVLLVSLFISAGIVHFVLWIAGGANAGIGTTTRVVAFAMGPQLFVIVPVLGAVVALFWMVWISIVGLREAHRTESWRAALAVLLPAFALVALIVLMFLVMLATGAGLVPVGLPGSIG